MEFSDEIIEKRELLQGLNGDVYDIMIKIPCKVEIRCSTCEHYGVPFNDPPCVDCTNESGSYTLWKYKLKQAKS